MNDKIKRVKQADIPPPVHEDLIRLAKSMRNVLRRRYANPIDRQTVAKKIMQDVQAV